MRKIFLVYLIITLFLSVLSQTSVTRQAIKDVAIHRGYKMIYSFKDHHYLDLQVIPNPNLNDWLALTIEKGLNGTNQLSLQIYTGNDVEQVTTQTSNLDVGSCKQIRTFIKNETIFIIPVKCGKLTYGVTVAIVDSQSMTITPLMLLPHSAVSDAQFWSNIQTQQINLIVLSKPQVDSNTKATMSHYKFNAENATFIKDDTFRLTDASSATVFDIDHKTYIAISNYRNVKGEFSNSEIFVQNEKFGGKLIKHQRLRSKGAISMAYFCYVGKTKTEHFLLATNNKLLKDSLKSKTDRWSQSPEESIIFKWENDYFIPFQTLLAAVPSPWITVPSSNDVLVLLTWSYIEGIISYQYDGWRFRRTALRQQDILNLDGPNFAFLKPVSIAGQTLFTIFTSKGKAKRKHFFVPIFKDNRKTRMTYEEKMDWCKNTFLELRLAWNEFEPRYQYLKQLNSTTNTSEENKIMSLFDLVLGNYAKPRLSDTGLEIMSLQGTASFESILPPNTESQKNEKFTKKKIELPKAAMTIPVPSGVIELNEFGRIVYYSLTDNGTASLGKGVELYYLKNVTKVTSFHLIEMCRVKGIFIQGSAKEKPFGKVYTIGENYKLKLFLQLHVSQDSSISVKGYCSERHGDCFVITPAKYNSLCSIQCGYDLLKYFICATEFAIKSQVTDGLPQPQIKQDGYY